MKTRKLLSMLLALALIAGLITVPAFASGTEPATETPAETFKPNIDFSTLPAASAYKISPEIAQNKGDASGGTETFAKFTGDITSGIYIDISAEKLYLKLPEGVTISNYSVDGGTKWKSGSIGAEEGADISKLLNKDLSLVLITSYDKKGKKITEAVQGKAAEGDQAEVKAVEAATVITFPAIKARPKADKLVINYLPFADATGKTAGQWTLTAKGAEYSAETLAGLQLAMAGEDKKTPSEVEEGKTWGKFPAAAGINVKQLPSTGKADKTVYLVRTEPKTGEGNWQPASKAFKVSASSEIKAPSMKADYKKEQMKAKAGLSAYFGTFDALKAAETLNDYNKDAAAGTIAKNLTKDAAKAGLDISGYLTESRQPMTMWMAASDKKPASAKQEVSLAARAYLYNHEYTPVKGKFKLLKEAAQTHEILKDEATGKFGNLPKIEGNTTLKVRAKATAKGGKEDENTFAASQMGSLNITYDVYNPGEKTEKKGVVAASVVAPNYSGVLVSRLNACDDIVYGDTGKNISFNVTGLLAAGDIGIVDGSKVKVEVKTDKVDANAVVKITNVAVTTETVEGVLTGKVTAKLEGAKAGSASVWAELTVASDDETYVSDARARRYTQKKAVTVAAKELEIDTTATTAKPTFKLEDTTSTQSYKFSFNTSLKGLMGSGVKIKDDAGKDLKVEYVYSNEDSDVSITAKVTAVSSGKGTLIFTLDVTNANYAASAAKGSAQVGYETIIPVPKTSAEIANAFLKGLKSTASAYSAYTSGAPLECQLGADEDVYTIPTDANLTFEKVSSSPAGVTLGADGKLGGSPRAADSIVVKYTTKNGSTSAVSFYVKYTLE